MNRLLKVKKIKLYKWLVLAAFVLLAPLFLKGTASAAAPAYENYCTAGSANTVGALFSNASSLSSDDGTASTTVYAQAHICNKAPGGYGVTDLHIVWYSVTRTAGTGNMSPTSRNFALGNLSGAGNTSAAISQAVNLSGLSEGNNCWRLYYSMNGLYGGVRDDSGPGFYWNVCVDYHLNVDRARCSMSVSDSTLTPGQAFTGTWNVRNAGDFVWSVDSSNSERYQIRPISPSADTTVYGSPARRDIAGYSAGIYGMVLTPGDLSPAFTHSFTAPATPGTYNFRWQVVWTGHGAVPADATSPNLCEVTLTVAPVASLDGVKIDDTGLSPAGDSTAGGWGGNCWSGSYPAACNNGTMSQYPFSDDQVCVSGAGCSSINYFLVNNIPLGTRTVTVTAGTMANTGWRIKGFSICPTGASCTTQFLTQDPPNVTYNTTGSMSYPFSLGQRYSMRWIYEPIPVTCAVTSALNPAGAAERLESITFNATGGGGNSTFVWSAPGGSPSSGSSTANFTTNFSTLGSKTITVTSGSVGVNCNVTIVDKPYFKLTGGDIAAGLSAVAPGCPGWGVGGDGTLTAWNDALTGGDPNVGAGTNLAAFATDVISGVASAQATSGSSPPKGLSFANTAGTFGGSFGGGILCPTDYYTKLSTAPATALTSGIDPGTTSLNYSATGPITLIGDTIGLGNRPTVFINGDVQITGNITFTAGATTVAQLPNLYLVVKGNIYIAPGVTRLDGVYVAQPNGAAGGKIYTCSNGFAPPTIAQLNNQCRTNVLTVNGALIAEEVKLYRTNGSMSFGPAAENFVFTPASWLATPAPLRDGSLGDYDSIDSLPPVL